jgi:hypothetical protein
MPPADVSAKASPAASQPRDRWFHGVHAHFVPSMSRERDVPPGAAVALAPPSSLKDLDVYGTLREKHVRLSRGQIRAMYSDVRERTKRALAGLSPAQLRAVPEPSLNPFDWGLGHIAHFYEFMILRLLAPETPEDAFPARPRQARAVRLVQSRARRPVAPGAGGGVGSGSGGDSRLPRRRHERAAGLRRTSV